MKKKIILVNICLLLLLFSVFIFKSDLFNFWQDEPIQLSKQAEQSPHKDALLKMSKTYPEVKTILEHLEDYPDQLVAALINNSDMLDFVLGYPTRNNKTESIQLNKKENAPYLYQWDKKWGYANYGDDFFALTGCAPTALSIAVVQLTKNTDYSPSYIAQISENSGFYVPDIGTSWELMSSGANYLGLQSTELSNTKINIDNELKAGNLVICSMLPGDFTQTGHFIVLVGVNKDGSYEIRDPNSKSRSSKSWNYDTLAPQINNLWVISR